MSDSRPDNISVRYGTFEEMRNLLTYVDAKNKTSRAFLATFIAVMDEILQLYEKVEEAK